VDEQFRSDDVALRFGNALHQQDAGSGGRPAEFDHILFLVLGVLDLGFAALDLDGLSANGIGGGLYVGYDYALSNTVFFGVEANANYSGASLSAELTDGTDSINGKIRARESFGLSGRLGAMLSDSTAVYAKGGWQSTKFKLNAFDGVDSYKAKDTQDALVYGAGLETRISAQTSIRVEYLIEDYGSAGLNSGFDTNGIRVDNNKLSLGISMRY